MYLAVLGRQAEISLAELEAIYQNVRQISQNLAIFDADTHPEIDKLGGCLKIAKKLEIPPLEYLSAMPEGKITVGVSDYSNAASLKTARLEAMRLKKILVRHGRSVRVVLSDSAAITTAAALHNGLSSRNPRKRELIKVDDDWYEVIGVQNIDEYAKRDQGRPARDAKVGMLPPKLAQILINLNGRLPEKAVVLDPFCGTGVLLQEALLMGYSAYGTDISERILSFSKKNLDFLGLTDYKLELGDATIFQWQQPIDAAACECYLGKPMTKIPSEMELKEQKQQCKAIILSFLENLSKQIKSTTPVTIAIPAWLNHNHQYSRLEILDEIDKLGYNVNNKSYEGLFYMREGQIVARDIIILRKK